jgi:hypothetical protein
LDSTLTVAGNTQINSTGNLLTLNATSGVAYQKFNENGTGRFFLATLNGADGLAFVDADGSSERMRIDASGNVGIGTTSPSKKLVISDGGNQGIELSPAESGVSRLFSYNRSSNAYTTLQIQGADLRFFTNASSNAERMRIDTSGNVGIGTSSPAHQLDVRNSAGTDTEAFISVGNSDNSKFLGLYSGRANNAFPTIYVDSTSTALRFAFADDTAFNGFSEKMRITSDGTLKTTAGSNVSTVSGSTSFLIHESADVKNVADSSTGSASYRDMHRFYCNKSGQFKCKWQALIHSGSHYWAGRFLLNGSQMKKSDNSTDAIHYFGSSLESGQTASVHQYRTFEMDLGDVKAGDVIQYQMVSAGGTGTPVDGAGQHLRMRNFQVYSSTPSNMSSPVIGESLGQADTSSQNMTGLTIGSVGVDNKAGMALKTQFALHDEWNDICFVNNAGTTGVTFLINATRDLDQNRHKTALVRYAYNETFTEISNSQQNTTIAYQVSDNRLQYRFTSAGNYLVTLLVMTGG